MKKNILIIVLFSILIPMLSIADDTEMSSPGLDITPTPVEEVSAPSDATATDSSSTVAPEPMEEATFDDVSYE